MVRGKFVCMGSVRTWVGNPNQRQFRFSAQYDQSIPEDRRFQAATPTGEITMVVDNPAAIAEFEEGKAFYVDFTPVEDATAAEAAA